jgi:dihydroorotate dehydrogenase electron transfer subunit
MNHFSANILSNQPIAAEYYEIRFTWPASVPAPLAGQFVTIRVSPSTVPLLRRPLAISAFDRENGHAVMIYQKRGVATELLAAKSSAESLDVIGPLGSAFTAPVPAGRCILAAGGIGLGPMLFLGHSLLARSLPVTFIFGCRTKKLLPDMSLFAPLSPAICTDDGSAGYSGSAIDYLRTLRLDAAEPAVLFGCGPTAMLKALHEFSGEHGWRCQVSMEQVMACGVGACMGCVIPTRSATGYARVCTEGPVFDSKELVWT